jgi:DNA-binding IclR family transcriptional regulator
MSTRRKTTQRAGTEQTQRSQAAGASTGTSAPPPNRLIQSVDRALTLFKAIATDGPITRPELARSVGLNEGTAYRLLATLEHHELIDRDPRTGQYTVDYSVAHLVANVSHAGLARRARPILERLSEQARETAVLSVPRGLDTLPIDQAIAPQVVGVQWIGRRIPAHCAGTGKLLLAALPPAELDEYLSHPLEPRTERTITDPDELRRQIEHARRTGIAISTGEYEIGLNSISTAARDNHHQPIAFLTITGPNYRLPRERLKELTPLLQDAATALTKLLGTSPKSG